jgi:DNA replication protein DnaC
MRAARERDAVAALVRRGVLPEHADARLEDFDEATQAVGREFLENEAEVGLTIKGPVGSGKTRFAAALAREFWVNQLREIAAVSAADLFGRLRATFRDGASESDEDVIRELRDDEVLLVDDLGFEGTTTPLVISALHRIVTTRIGFRKLTIVSTNLKIEEIETVYGAAIASRISSWRQFVFTGADRRKRLNGAALPNTKRNWAPARARFVG